MKQYMLLYPIILKLKLYRSHDLADIFIYAATTAAIMDTG